MRIFNEEKTIELTNPDLEHGYKYPDKLLIKHADEIPEKVIKTVEQVVEELRAQGEEVLLNPNNGNYELTLKYYPPTETRLEGRDAKTVEPVIEPAVPAKDEYEDIEVYHPYTDEEYIIYLRQQRDRICFPVINRGAAWYARLTPEQSEELQEWYQAWLDVTVIKVKPETPSWI